MVSLLASNVVDRVFESQTGQTKDYEIGICCFSAKYAVLRCKSKDSGQYAQVERHVYLWSVVQVSWRYNNN